MLNIRVNTRPASLKNPHIRRLVSPSLSIKEGRSSTSLSSKHLFSDISLVFVLFSLFLYCRAYLQSVDSTIFR
ncbi:hypothetical protein POPTR_009G072966v4 [Populus trichocarpa]|uniref:Uncharacterized protein n=1 Tax=Populus trichocarpa TaxID=3694 RepID=A0ACC0SGZ1_POPTR|nr:hypothetical protein POPTR_009G072966v4 [Populus trichocarpa]